MLKDTKTRHRHTFYFSTELAKLLVERAKKNDRSVNKEALHLMKLGLEAEQQAVQKTIRHNDL